MNHRIKEVVVVEGRHDEARLKTVFPDLDVVITQGASISESLMNRLKKLNEARGLILMLDPDYPGDKIRKTINQHVGPTKHVHLKKADCISKNKTKIGIEHAPLKIIEKSIKLNVLNSNKINQWTMKDLNELKLAGHSESRKKRHVICDYFHLGQCNAKTFLKRLNMFGIDKATLKKVLI